MFRPTKDQLEAAGYWRGTWGPDDWCDWVWQDDVIVDGVPVGSNWECRNCKNRTYQEPSHYSPGTVFNGLPECPAYAVLAVCLR